MLLQKLVIFTVIWDKNLAMKQNPQIWKGKNKIWNWCTKIFGILEIFSQRNNFILCFEEKENNSMNLILSRKLFVNF